MDLLAWTQTLISRRGGEVVLGQGQAVAERVVKIEGAAVTTSGAGTAMTQELIGCGGFCRSIKGFGL